MKNLEQNQTAVLLIDLQEKLVPYLDRSCEVMARVATALQAFQTLHCPILVTEQYPEGLGQTIPQLKRVLGEQQQYHCKTTFSCLGDEKIKEIILSSPQNHWILLGAEAHVCILQTAKDLLSTGKEVTILNDTITSRSIFDFSTAIAEMRDCGVRISSLETVLFELVKDSKNPNFKAISELIKPCNTCPCSS